MRLNAWCQSNIKHINIYTNICMGIACTHARNSKPDRKMILTNEILKMSILLKVLGIYSFYVIYFCEIKSVVKTICYTLCSK